MRHASSTPSLYLSLTSRLPCRHPTPSPPAVLVAVNSSYLPTRSPHTPPETPNHHSATPSGLVRRAPRLLLHTTADHLRLAERCASIRPNPLLASLACCPLFRDQPSAKPPFSPYIANLSVFRATRCGYLRFVPVYRGHLPSGGLLLEEHRKQSLARINRKRDHTTQSCKRS